MGRNVCIWPRQDQTSPAHSESLVVSVLAGVRRNKLVIRAENSVTSMSVMACSVKDDMWLKGGLLSTPLVWTFGH